MSSSENVISQLAVKLKLDASGFDEEEIGEALDGMGARLEAFCEISGNVMKDAVTAAMDFETAFTGVKKTVDAPIGVDADSFFQDLQSDILNLSGELPVAATEIADVYAAAGQLGISAENLTGFSTAMLQLASATNLTSDQAATSLAQFANVMGTDQTLFGNMGSAIVELGNNMATNEAQIVNFAQEMAIAGKLSGISEADILGFGASMDSMGLDAASPFSALRSAANTPGTIKETGSHRSPRSTSSLFSSSLRKRSA